MDKKLCKNIKKLFNIPTDLEGEKLATHVKRVLRKDWSRAGGYHIFYTRFPLLALIPDSLVNLEIRNKMYGCPRYYSYLKKLPHLLNSGHEGQYITFGYRPTEWTVGETPDQTSENFRKNFRTVVPGEIMYHIKESDQHFLEALENEPESENNENHWLAYIKVCVR
jgi:hypothetical protein